MTVRTVAGGGGREERWKSLSRREERVGGGKSGSQKAGTLGTREAGEEGV